MMQRPENIKIQIPVHYNEYVKTLLTDMPSINSIPEMHDNKMSVIAIFGKLSHSHVKKLTPRPPVTRIEY